MSSARFHGIKSEEADAEQNRDLELREDELVILQRAIRRQERNSVGKRTRSKEGVFDDFWKNAMEKHRREGRGPTRIFVRHPLDGGAETIVRRIPGMTISIHMTEKCAFRDEAQAFIDGLYFFRQKILDDVPIRSGCI